MNRKETKQLWHQSGVSPAGEPFVQILHDGKIIGQMSPEQCREHATAMFEAAEAAETDAMLVAFLNRRIGLDTHTAGVVLIDFRKQREARGKSGGTVTDKSRWVVPESSPEPSA